jgi:short-subunit dehydrogenase
MSWEFFTESVPCVRTSDLTVKSMAGIMSGPWFAPYVTSKFALVAMSQGLAVQLKLLGIGVFVLCP